MNFCHHLRLFVVLNVLNCFAALTAHAYDTNPILLTIKSEESGIIEFTFDDLQKIPAIEFNTSTIWTKGTQVFTGVSLKSLLNMNGIVEGHISATAVNNYVVDIPYSEISDNAPIIAYKVNNKRMSLRQKGPLWLVYPYDSSKEYQTETVYARSIWQLDRLEVK